MLVPACPPIDSRSIDESVEPFRRRVHGRRETRGAGTDDDHVERPAAGRRRCACPCPCCASSSAPGSTSGVPSGRTTIGTSAPCWPHAREVLLALVRVRRVEGMRDAVSREVGAQRVAARRPGVGDDGDLAPPRSVLSAPLLQELRDEAMEELVRRAERLERVVVDVAERHRALDRVGGLVVGPATPGDEERALRMRMEVVDALQQLLALQVAACRALRERPQPLPRAREAARAARARRPSTARRSPGSRVRSAGARS